MAVNPRLAIGLPVSSHVRPRVVAMVTALNLRVFLRVPPSDLKILWGLKAESS